MWTGFWGEAGGPLGQEVTDFTEDTILPHLTTDNPICTGDPSGEPAFNTQVNAFNRQVKLWNLMFNVTKVEKETRLTTSKKAKL